MLLPQRNRTRLHFAVILALLGSTVALKPHGGEFSLGNAHFCFGLLLWANKSE